MRRACIVFLLSCMVAVLAVGLSVSPAQALGPSNGVSFVDLGATWLAGSPGYDTSGADIEPARGYYIDVHYDATGYPGHSFTLSVLVHCVSGSYERDAESTINGGNVTSSFAVNTGNTCGGANANVADGWSLQTSDDGDTTFTTIATAGSLATGPTSSCDASFVSLSAGPVSGGVTVAFQWHGTIPTHGWKAYGLGSATDDTPGGSPDALVPTDDLTGRDGWYGVSWTVSPAPAYVRVVSTADTDCFAQDAVTDGNGTGEPSDTGESGGVHCGLNIFCSIKAAVCWAVCPDPDSVSSAEGTFTSLADKAPWGYVPLAVSWFGDALDDADSYCGSESESCPGLTFYAAGDVAVPILGEDSPGLAILTTLRPELDAAVWAAILLPLAFFLYRKLTPGGSDS